MVRLPAAAAAMMAPRVSPAFQNLPRQAVAPPSVEDVKRHLYGSVEKFDAANQASIAEAQQRSNELTEKTYSTPAYQPPVHSTLAPADLEPPRPVAQPTDYLEPVEEGGDADEIEDAAEYGEEEAFEGWNIGLGERIVGVTDNLRRSVPVFHIRRRQATEDRITRRRKAPKVRRREILRRREDLPLRRR